MKCILWTFIALSGAGVGANAQTELPATTSTRLSPSDQKALDAAHSLVIISELWNKPLDWKEVGSSTTQIVAHVRKALGDSAPSIEVRSKDSPLSTFQLEQAPLGPTLSSVAELAGGKLWVLPGRLVLAPETSLTAEESALIQRRVAGEWQLCSTVTKFGWSPRKEFERISIQILGDEIRDSAKASAKTETVPTGATSPIRQRAFGELTPSSQQVVQDLVKEFFRQFPLVGDNQPGLPAPVITPDILICIDDSRKETRRLFFKPQDASTKFPPLLGGIQWQVRRIP